MIAKRILSKSNSDPIPPLLRPSSESHPLRVKPKHLWWPTGPARSAPFPPPSRPSVSTQSHCSATLASSMFIKHARRTLTSGSSYLWKLWARKLLPQMPALLAPSSPHIFSEVSLVILSKLHNRPPNTPPSACLMFSPEQLVPSNILYILPVFFIVWLLPRPRTQGPLKTKFFAFSSQLYPSHLHNSHNPVPCTDLTLYIHYSSQQHDEVSIIYSINAYVAYTQNRSNNSVYVIIIGEDLML